ncbi:unnamed protein product [Chrysoparadoxa australica]
MFSLVAGFMRQCLAKPEANILILGLDYAGKTTLLEQMKGLFKRTPGIPPDKIPPTVGLNVTKMSIFGCTVTFWDLGGQLKMRSLWSHYFEDAHGLVFVIDSADVGRFEEAKLAFDSMMEEGGQTHGIPTLLLANKQDLPDACTEAEISQLFGVSQEFLLDHAFRLQPISALTRCRKMPCSKLVIPCMSTLTTPLFVQRTIPSTFPCRIISLTSVPCLTQGRHLRGYPMDC